MERKVIGQATGYKLSELQELEDGNILKVGGREVLVHMNGSSIAFISLFNRVFHCEQIQEQISETAYASGGSFPEKNLVQTSSIEKPAVLQTQPPARPFSKGFIPPSLKEGSSKLPEAYAGKSEIKPKHNPAGHQALVMPRPPSDIQVSVIFDICVIGIII